MASSTRVSSATVAALLFVAVSASAAPFMGGAVRPSPPVAINDLGTTRYKAFPGGLYPGGSNDVPTVHRAAGIARALQVEPLDSDGDPDAGGKIVLLSIGMSNATQEFCFDWDHDLDCENGTFMAQALADAAVDDDDLVIVDGAQAFVTADQWDDSADAAYNTVRDVRLDDAGVTEAQVQVVWVKNARSTPSVQLPASNADAYSLETNFGNTMRALKTRYPNCKLVFMSSRAYGGFANGVSTLNPEPYAYEGGFAVKWVIEAQITQMSGGGTDSQSGDLNYSNGTAPWIAWGPYLWANGTTARSDGVSYASSDFGPDGTHPSSAGIAKIGGLLLTFFKTSPFTKCWFLAAHPVCE